MEENNKPLEAKNEEFSGTFDSPDEAKIDFEGIRTLNRDSMKPDPFYLRLGRGIVELLLRLLLLIAQVIFDVGKAVLQVVVGVFKYAWLGIKGIGRWFRNKGRMLLETDWLRRLNLILNGIGYAKSKQWGNMVVFLCTEILFIAYMFLVGGNSLVRFVNLGQLTEGEIAASAHDVSIRVMVLGILTVFIILGYFFVWNKGVQGGYDMYQIENLYDYKQGHADALRILSHLEEFDEDLTKLSRHKIRVLMRTKYGYSDLSSRIISYVDFKRIPDKKPLAIVSFGLNLKGRFYAWYAKIGKKLNQSTWHTVFAKYLVWTPKPYVHPYGSAYVNNLASASYYRFLHTYDKYNDYIRCVRDRSALIKVISNQNKVIQCVYAEDESSVRNGIPAISRNDPKAKLPTKGVASRIVGAFECSFETAVEAAKLALNAIRQSQLTAKKSKGLEAPRPEEILESKADSISDALSSFQKKWRDDKLAELDRQKSLLQKSDLLLEMAEEGETCFLNQLKLQFDLDKDAGAKLYKEVSLAKKTEDPKDNLSRRLAHFEAYAAQFESTPLHPSPTTFSKQLKAFGDEKFAVTVMALPTIGCLLVTIIPLIFSILLAFTNWDTMNQGAGNFGWSNSGFPALFGFGEGMSTMPRTLVTLFIWTMVWAVFATFLNYIFGIVLALLIQRKTIRGKAFWRTIFIISIAIPQFITLLVIAKFFGDHGVLNSWLGSFTHGVEVAGADGAIITTYYTGSGTPEDPYVIVGEQGFLGWISGWKDWNGNSIVSGLKSLTNYVEDADGTIRAVTLEYATKESYIGFFSNSNWGGWDAGLLSVRAVLPKINIILINCWVGIPYTMLSTMGILMNIPEDLYESSRIDGANSWTQFWKITMPYVLFVTGPNLLTSFIGNINNFNVIYFLTGGNPNSQMALTSPAGYTDLLITWIYKMTVTATTKQYYLASALGCVIFLICAFFSLLMYGKLGSTKNEEEFQ